QPAAGEDEPPAAVPDGRDDRARVAGQLVAHLIPDLAGLLVEGDDAAPRPLHFPGLDAGAAGRASADRDDQELAFHDRRAPHAEEVLRDRKLPGRVPLPDLRAVDGPETGQHALDAEEIDAVAVDHRAAAGARIVAVHVLVLVGVLVLPQH